jgi:hypothetical protein
VTRTTTTRLISEQLLNVNSRKRTRLALKPKLDPKRSLWPSLFLLINALKRQLKPETTANSKKRKEQGRLNPSYLLKINLTTSSDEGEDYLFTSSKPLSSSKTKLAKSSHPTAIY